MKRKRLWLAALILTVFVLPLASLSPVRAADETVLASADPEYSLIKIEHEDNEKLFELYAAKLFGVEAAETGEPARSPSRVAAKGAMPTGDSLTEKERLVYNYLKTEAGKIANGEGATGYIRIPLEELGLKASCTASDLGLDYLYDFDSGTVNPDLAAAIAAYTSVDCSAVFDRLYADCPYEFYWAAGETTGPSSFGYGLSATGPDDVTLTLDPTTYNIGFKPDPLFHDTADTSSLAAFAVDTAKTGAASRAKDCAEAIVADAAGLSDYGKLVYYKDQICELVEYNEAAAASGGPSGYGSGSPWALIYVFDQDEETNVVCEGYAEAFQYLCSLTDFNSDDICCYSVTGQMTGATGAGPHKWNIVHMDDGKNYIADITNSDDGTVGSDGSLFLKKYASGSVAAGYTFNGSYGSTITFEYDDSTTGIFLSKDLTLSASDYVVGGAKVTGHRMWLSAEIGVQFKVFAPGGIAKNSYMEFELSDGKKQTMTIDDAFEEGDGIYAFTCFINPIELADTITATYHYSVDGSEETITDTYSAMTYITAARATFNYNEGLMKLLDALQNYGHYLLNSGWTDGRQHAELEIAYELTDDFMSMAVGAVAEDEISKTMPADSGVEDIMFSLMLNSQTQIYYYAKLSDSVTLRTEADSTEVIEGETYYQFSSAPIGPLGLGESFDFTIQTGGGSATVTASAMSYVHAILYGETYTEAQKYAMAALYFYYTAAQAYS